MFWFFISARPGICGTKGQIRHGRPQGRQRGGGGVWRLAGKKGGGSARGHHPGKKDATQQVGDANGRKRECAPENVANTRFVRSPSLTGGGGGADNTSGFGTFQA